MIRVRKAVAVRDGVNRLGTLFSGAYAGRTYTPDSTVLTVQTKRGAFFIYLPTDLIMEIASTLMGRKGGQAVSRAKTRASQLNGMKGGRPPKRMKRT